MIYTAEEKKKMDDVLQAFAEYTAVSTEFDVAYSDKAGYVRLIIDEGADQFFFYLNGFDDLVNMFCMEIVSEEVEKQLFINPSVENQDVDYDIIRLRLQGYIDRMLEENRQRAESVANAYILKRAMSPYLP